MKTASQKHAQSWSPCDWSSDPAVRALVADHLERDFRMFVRYFFRVINGRDWVHNWHHDEIVDALLKCHRHETKRLLINIPPRYGKTELAVVMFIAWCLAKNKAAQFIHLSYADELALDNSARVKDLVMLDEFQCLWPLSLNPDRKAKGLWRTAEGGGLKAGPAGGSVTGFGAGVGEEGFGGAIIIDDPLKPDDAESDVERNKINRRLNSTIASRVNAKATPIIMIMQRLHDDDAAGFVLGGGTGEPWEHLKIPVIDDKGKPLWPFRHTEKELAAIRMADKYVWNGQYMQEPIPDEGDYFHADGARWYETLPEHLTFYGSSDYAVTEGGGDFTEHAVWGVCPQGNIYAVDWWSGQTKADRWIEEQLDLCAKWKPVIWAGETGPIKASVEPWLKRRMRERDIFVPLRWVNHSTAKYKTANARSLQAMWEQGRVYLPKDKQWASDLLSQLTRFPRGKLDDKVDTCGIFARTIQKVWELDPPKQEEEPKQVPEEPLVIEKLWKPRRETTW